jgi:hypothetical protein
MRFSIGTLSYVFYNAVGYVVGYFSICVLGYFRIYVLGYFSVCVLGYLRMCFRIV